MLGPELCWTHLIPEERIARYTLSGLSGRLAAVRMHFSPVTQKLSSKQSLDCDCPNALFHYSIIDHWPLCGGQVRILHTLLFTSDLLLKLSSAPSGMESRLDSPTMLLLTAPGCSWPGESSRSSSWTRSTRATPTWTAPCSTWRTRTMDPEPSGLAWTSDSPGLPPEPR